MMGLAAAGGFLAGTAVAPAQSDLGGPIPDDTITSMSISAAQADDIRSRSSRALDQLAEGDPAGVSAARAWLQAPLENVRATVAFRVAYSESLVPRLSSLAAGPDETIAVNALYVAGDLATDPASGLIDQSRADGRPAVRFAAVYAMARTLRAVQGAGAPAINPERCSWIVRQLGSGLQTEQDPLVADMYARALIYASKMDRETLRPVAQAAFEELVRSISRRAQSTRPEDATPEALSPLLRAGEEVREVLAQNVLRKSLPQTVVRDSAALGGDLMALTTRLLRASALPQVAAADDAVAAEAKRNARAPHQTACRLAASIIGIAKDTLGVGTPGEQPPDLAGPLGQASREGDARVLSDSRLWVEVLAQMQLPADRFLR